MIVVDASIVMTWYLDDEATVKTEAVFDRVSVTDTIAPAIWRLEIANAFRTAIRKKRVTLAYRDASLIDLAALDIQSQGDTFEYAWTGILKLADKHGLTPYDAAYLELAIRLNATLATLDEALIVAARSEGVPLLP